jgi:hypothetical protein
MGLAESGCDLCHFIRKHLEKVSEANHRRLDGKARIVLQDCHGKISLDYRVDQLQLEIGDPLYRLAFLTRPISDTMRVPLGETPYDPVLHACKLLEACLLMEKNGHGDCEPANMSPPLDAISLPRRLLDLSHDEIVSTIDVQVWIVTARATVEELSNYCTLSYRWGRGAPDCMLRTHFIGERLISLASMPQTFKDAIAVARALRIRFIWIDALCIVQPSAHGDFTDWNAEGPRMWLVYQNAVCTIAATCSKDPMDGFLSKVGIDRIPPICVPHESGDTGIARTLLVYPGTSAFHGSVVASNLNRRGWVAQERLLSRRILHFTEEGVYRECQAIDKTQNNPGEFQTGFTMGLHHASSLSFGEWLEFIEFYSASEFTHLTDRLLALSSIAKSVLDKQFGTTYIAGIWTHRLLNCLSWSAAEPCCASSRASCLTIAPSWSWASVPGRVKYHVYNLEEPQEIYARLEEDDAPLCQAKIVHGDLKRSPLKLLARLCSISLPLDGKRKLSPNISNYSGLSPPTGFLHWDELPDNSVAETIHTFIPLSLSTYGRGRRHRCKALVVIPALLASDKNDGDSCKVYRRIGYVEIEWSYSDGEHGLFDVLFPDAFEETIIII